MQRTLWRWTQISLTNQSCGQNTYTWPTAGQQHTNSHFYFTHSLSLFYGPQVSQFTKIVPWVTVRNEHFDVSISLTWLNSFQKRSTLQTTLNLLYVRYIHMKFNWGKCRTKICYNLLLHLVLCTSFCIYVFFLQLIFFFAVATGSRDCPYLLHFATIKKDFV